MELKPQKIMEGGMAFMFESSLMLGVSEWALKQAHVQELYSEHSWGNLKRRFPENMEMLSNASKNSADAPPSME
jgi:homogentisate 1,2-dioxygenase